MSHEKFDKELERIDLRIRELNDQKKDVQKKKDAALKREVLEVFENKKIPLEQLLILEKLSQTEIEGIISAAEKKGTLVPEREEKTNESKTIQNVPV